MSGHIATTQQHAKQQTELVNLMQSATAQTARAIAFAPHPHGVVSGFVVARVKGQNKSNTAL